MNKKAEIGDVLIDNVIHLIFLALFFIGMVWFVASYQNGAAIWEDYYAKEIVKVINFAEPRDEVWLDVHNATEIAKKNKLASFSEIFQLDNVKNEVCVKLNKGKKTCYSYFNDVDVVNFGLKLAEGKNDEGKSVNLLYFKVIEVQNKADEKDILAKEAT